MYPEKIRLPKIGSQKFDQNLFINSGDIADMYKCRQDICCMDKCYRDSWHLLKMVQESYFQSLDKIGSVTAEIFLIWTNVAMTNVAQTNVNVKVGICSRCPQEPMFKVSSRSSH